MGYGIAERLASERNDVSVIDTSAHLIQAVRDNLDVRGFVGHGSHPEVLEAAGAQQADMIIAVTLYDEVNIVACEIAHALFNVPTKIARIRAQSYLQPQYQDLFSREHMPIDVIISPEREVGELVLRRIALPGASDVVRFAEGNVIALAIECLEDCPVINTPLKQLTDLFPDLPSIVVAIVRKGNLFIPHSADQMLAGDVAYVLTQKDQVRRTLGLFGHEEQEATRIVIAGGGNIGLYVARTIEQRQARTRIKIIEAAMHGRPVVSTTVGVEGLELRPDHVEVVIADGAEAFAQELARLLGDMPACQRIGAAGRARAVALYDERKVIERIALEISEVMRASARSS